ncbi:MAG: 4-hydroxy-tetrahydrodipicolinate reductase, partial [Armatimonadetes bacterium]|nr:4-hydroxy-tetrahydrodipicolinate reductase [Armatimonadota bacterium]
EMIIEGRGEPLRSVLTTHQQLDGCRGGELSGVRIHSVRLPGYVANQEVVFGSQGETLVIEHVSTSRECFMPGVLLAIRRVREFDGLVYGIDALL